MDYSEQIRIEMARQQISDRELSEKSGVSRPIVANARQGKAKNIDALQKLADALNIPLVIEIKPSNQTDMVSI